jgi:hypothetical protein
VSNLNATFWHLLSLFFSPKADQLNHTINPSRKGSFFSPRMNELERTLVTKKRRKRAARRLSASRAATEHGIVVKKILRCKTSDLKLTVTPMKRSCNAKVTPADKWPCAGPLTFGTTFGVTFGTTLKGASLQKRSLSLRERLIALALAGVKGTTNSYTTQGAGERASSLAKGMSNCTPKQANEKTIKLRFTRILSGFYACLTRARRATIASFLDDSRIDPGWLPPLSVSTSNASAMWNHSNFSNIWPSLGQLLEKFGQGLPKPWGRLHQKGQYPHAMHVHAPAVSGGMRAHCGRTSDVNLRRSIYRNARQMRQKRFGSFPQICSKIAANFPQKRGNQLNANSQAVNQAPLFQQVKEHRRSKREQIQEFFTDRIGQRISTSFLHGKFGTSARTRISEINRDLAAPITIRNKVSGVNCSEYWAERR